MFKQSTGKPMPEGILRFLKPIPYYPIFPEDSTAKDVASRAISVMQSLFLHMYTSFSSSMYFESSS